MGTLERREREKSETRTKIMDAARVLFADRGYDAVSMRKIAEAIEYSPTAIYVHFKDKEALLREICQHDFNALAGVFRDLSAIADPVERIRRTGYTYIEFALRQPQHYRLMFMTPFHGSEAGHVQPTPEELELMRDPERDAYAFLRKCVADAMAAGAFRTELTSIELVAQTLWAGVHGVASLEIALGKDPCLNWEAIEQRTRLMIDVCLRGLFREGGRP